MPCARRKKREDSVVTEVRRSGIRRSAGPPTSAFDVFVIEGSRHKWIKATQRWFGIKAAYQYPRCHRHFRRPRP